MPKAVTAASSRARSVAFCGISVALLAVSAWITVPIGPVPVTLQTFAEMLVLIALKPREAVSAIAIYLLAGAIGLPFFSGMKGGVGVIMGPTGGFLWGFLVAGIVFVALRSLVNKKQRIAVDYVLAFVFLAIVYALGWFQLMAVNGLSTEAAFAVGVAPFIVPDAVKIAAAVPVAQAVARAL
ncbi:MAG: biotin transporter BioY [Eggerthellaceae bacterium]|nr:biotin transporter BioY [Eggerthellaceae bacterium]